MNISSSKEFECETCILSKTTNTRSREADIRAIKPFELIHTDLAGPIDRIAKDGFRYAMILRHTLRHTLDAPSRISWRKNLMHQKQLKNSWLTSTHMEKSKLSTSMLMYSQLVKLNVWEAIMVESIFQINSNHFLLVMESNMNSQHHILHTKTERLSETGELSLTWHVHYLLSQGYRSTYGHTH